LIKHATITITVFAEYQVANTLPEVELTDVRGIARVIEYVSQVTIYRHIDSLHYLKICAPEHHRPLRLFIAAYADHINSRITPDVNELDIGEKRSTTAIRLLGAYATSQSSQALALRLEINFENLMFSMADESSNRLGVASMGSLLCIPETKVYSMVAAGLLRNEVPDPYTPEFSYDQLSETIIWHRPQ
jgi:hypothetical protein